MPSIGAGVFIQTACPISRIQSSQVLPQSRILRNPNHVSSLGVSSTSQGRDPGLAFTPPNFFFHQRPERVQCDLFSVGLQKSCWPHFSVGGCDPQIMQNSSPVLLPSSLHCLLLSPTFLQLMSSLPPALTHLCKNVKVPMEAPFCKLLSTQFPESADCQKSFFSEFLLTHRKEQRLWFHIC